MLRHDMQPMSNVDRATIKIGGVPVVAVKYESISEMIRTMIELDDMTMRRR